MSKRIWPPPKGERPHILFYWFRLPKREEPETIIDGDESFDDEDDPEPLTGNVNLIDKVLTPLGEGGGCVWFPAREKGPPIPVFTSDGEESFCVTDGTDDPQDDTDE